MGKLKKESIKEENLVDGKIYTLNLEDGKTTTGIACVINGEFKGWRVLVFDTINEPESIDHSEVIEIQEFNYK